MTQRLILTVLLFFGVTNAFACPEFIKHPYSYHKDDSMSFKVSQSLIIAYSKLNKVLPMPTPEEVKWYLTESGSGNNERFVSAINHKIGQLYVYKMAVNQVLDTLASIQYKELAKKEELLLWVSLQKEILDSYALNYVGFELVKKNVISHTWFDNNHETGIEYSEQEVTESWPMSRCRTQASFIADVLEELTKEGA